MNTGDLSEQYIKETGITDGIALCAQYAIRNAASKIIEPLSRQIEDLQKFQQQKSDKTLQTQADRQSGGMIREIIKDRFSIHEINEEEGGKTEGKEYTWYIDPLDGTASYARGQKYSTIGIAVYKNNLPFAASLCHPFEHELIIAKRNEGAYLFSLDNKFNITSSGIKLSVSKKISLDGGVIFVDAYFNEKNTSPKLETMKELIHASQYNLGVRMTGSNIDHQRQVASGRGEATLTDAVGGFFDLAVGALIIQEAGGEFTDIEGNAITEDSKVGIGTNGLIHNEVLKIVQKHYGAYKGFK